MQQPSPRPFRTAPANRLHALLIALACALCLVFAGAMPAQALEAPATSATAAILVDPATGTVLYESNADDTRYPASTTKIMTALLTLEKANLDDVVTIEEADLADVTSDSTIAGLLVGEQYTVRDLLYCLLLPSGNDAAYVLARYVGGSTQAFVQMMNDHAAELGCTNTHFVNPCGMPADDHYSCARDLYRMAYAAMQNPTFAEIVATRTYALPETPRQPARELKNTNLLLNPEESCYYEPCLGIKTGYTEDAGRCLVAAAEQNGLTLYCVVLGCPSAQTADEVSGSFTAARTLFEWGYANWSKRDVMSAGYEVQTAPVAAAADDAQLSIVVDGTVSGLVPNDLTPDQLQADVSLPESFSAPIDEGETLGTVTYSYNGGTLGTVNLVAGNKVALSLPALAQHIADCIVALAQGAAEQVLASRELTIAVACGAVAVVAIVVAAVIVHRKRRRARLAAQEEEAAADAAARATGALPHRAHAMGNVAVPVADHAHRNALDTGVDLFGSRDEEDDPSAPRSVRIARRVPHIGIGDEKLP